MKIVITRIFVSTIFILTMLTLISADFGGTASVYIPANQEFILGELEDNSFTAKLTNKGKQEVKVKVVSKENGEQTQGFGLNPGGQAKVSVSKYEKVFLINQSSKKAHVKVKLNKGVEGMRYQDLD